jgi:Alkylmercury lyase
MQDLNFQSQVRLEVYRQFIESGSCPAKSAIAQSLNRSLQDVIDALVELAKAHMLVLQPETGEVLMANPLSAVPTPFLVVTEQSRGPRHWYGNCIWDALGVISMLQADGTVVTSCGCCGEKMTVTVTSKKAAPQPDGIVHFALPARRWWDDIVFN